MLKETEFIVDINATQHVVHVDARTLGLVCVIPGGIIVKANSKSDELIVSPIVNLIIVCEYDRVLIVCLLGHIRLPAIVIDVGATSREYNRLIAVDSGLGGVNVQVDREHLQVLAPQPRLVAGLILLNLGRVLEDYDLTILQVQLVVLHSCFQLDHLGAVGYHTVVHGVNDVTPDSPREVVLVSIIHVVLNFGGLDGEFKRGPNHHILKWTSIICEGIIRERKEHRLVECAHICV